MKMPTVMSARYPYMEGGEKPEPHCDHKSECYILYPSHRTGLSIICFCRSVSLHQGIIKVDHFVAKTTLSTED